MQAPGAQKYIQTIHPHALNNNGTGVRIPGVSVNMLMEVELILIFSVSVSWTKHQCHWTLSHELFKIKWRKSRLYYIKWSVFIFM